MRNIAIALVNAYRLCFVADKKCAVKYVAVKYRLDDFVGDRLDCYECHITYCMTYSFQFVLLGMLCKC